MRMALTEGIDLDKIAREVARTAHEALESRAGGAKFNQDFAVEAYLRTRDILAASAVFPAANEGSGKSQSRLRQLADDLAMAYFMIAIVRVEEDGFESGLTETVRNALIPVLQKHISAGDENGRDDP